MMSVLSVESISVEDDVVNVTAVVENAVLVFKATYNDPEEYGPALCFAGFYLGEDELPTDENELLDYINNLDLDWMPYDVSDDYDF